MTRARLRAIGAGRPRRTARTYRFCAKGTRRVVTAVFASRARRARVRLVTSAAPGHRIGRGARGRRVFAVRRGQVRTLVVADRRTARSRAALRTLMRRAR